MVDNGKAKAKNLKKFLTNTLPPDTWTTSEPKESGQITVRCKSSERVAATDVTRDLIDALAIRDIKHFVLGVCRVCVNADEFVTEVA